MSDTDAIRNQIKTKLVKQYQAFRNLAIKISLLSGCIVFAIHFTYIVVTQDIFSIPLDQSLMQCGFSGCVFSAFGYLAGKLYSTYLERKHYIQLGQIMVDRKKDLKEQISIRESRVDALTKNASKAMY